MEYSKLYWLASDWLTSVRRSIRHIFRNVDSLITGLALPVAIMILFVIIFGGSINTGVDYVNYIVPGVILTCVGYGSSTTAMIVAHDMVGGLFERFRTLPIARSSMLIGHVIGSLIRNSMSAVLVFGVALLVGFRPNADLLEWGAVAGLLILAILMFSWLSVIFGLLVKSVDAAAAVSFGIIFLPYISSAFVPVHTLPGWLQGFAEHQPLTPVIETVRSLLIGTPMGDSWIAALLWMGSILIVSMTFALALFKRKARR